MEHEVKSEECRGNYKEWGGSCRESGLRSEEWGRVSEEWGENNKEFYEEYVRSKVEGVNSDEVVVRSEELEDPLVFSTAPVSVARKSSTQDFRYERGKLIKNIKYVSGEIFYLDLRTSMQWTLDTWFYLILHGFISIYFILFAFSTAY